MRSERPTRDMPMELVAPLDPKVFCGMPRPGTDDFQALVRFCESNSDAVAKSMSFMTRAVFEVFGPCQFLELIYECGGARFYFGDWILTGADPCAEWRKFKWRGAVLDRSKWPDISGTERARNGMNNSVLLPTPWGAMNAIRRVVVADVLRTTSVKVVSFAEIARQFGLSDRMVHKLRSQHDLQQPSSTPARSPKPADRPGRGIGVSTPPPRRRSQP